MLAMQEMDDLMADIDVYVSPSLGNANCWLTNATGHPLMVTPTAARTVCRPTILFTGRLYDEATVLAVAMAYQAGDRVPPGASQAGGITVLMTVTGSCRD